MHINRCICSVNFLFLGLQNQVSMKKTIFVLLTLCCLAQTWAQKSDIDKGIYASIQTNKGEIFLELYPEKAPLTVANFVGLAEGNLKVFDSIKHKEPYYDSVVFHRVISDFMIQGGDPTGTGSGGPGYQFWDEADNGLKHEKGVISMANAGPHTNGSQFFITHVATPHLNGKHTVFGKVLEGQDVVNKIEQNDSIQRMEIIRKGLKYKLFYNPSRKFKKAYEARTKVVEKQRLKKEKQEAQDKVRLIEAKEKSKEDYKSYFFDLIKEIDPDVKQTESGLVYKVTKEGGDTLAEPGDKVSVHYVGKKLYGDKFDASRDRGKPLEFKYQVQRLIKGFDEGIALVGEGGEVTVYIPYFLGYGKRGKRPQIPPYADLIFEIELLSVEKK